MKVLITGDRGFVGTETKKFLEANNVEWIGYDLMEKYDIRDILQLEEVVKMVNPDRILHLAAIARFADADKDP
jgi:dTDP-4-dehydrorhamnose reductase